MTISVPVAEVDGGCCYCGQSDFSEPVADDVFSVCPSQVQDPDLVSGGPWN
jgi:hypothetical protein